MSGAAPFTLFRFAATAPTKAPMNIASRLRATFVLGFALACAHGMAATTADVEPTAPAGAGPSLTSVRLATLRSLAAPADAGGSVDTGPGCLARAAVESNDAVRRRVESELPRAFAQEWANARVGSARFAKVSAGLEASAFINDLTARVCHVGDAAWRGRFYVQVAWQLVQRGSGQTVYMASTHGFFDQKEATAGTTSAAGLREAFAVAIRNLVADPRLASVLQPADSDEERLASALPY